MSPCLQATRHNVQLLFLFLNWLDLHMLDLILHVTVVELMLVVAAKKKWKAGRLETKFRCHLFGKGSLNIQMQCFCAYLHYTKSSLYRTLLVWLTLSVSVLSVSDGWIETLFVPLLLWIRRSWQKDNSTRRMGWIPRGSYTTLTSTHHFQAIFCSACLHWLKISD